MVRGGLRTVRRGGGTGGPAGHPTLCKVDTDVKTLRKDKRNEQLLRFSSHMKKMVVGQPQAIEKLSDSFSRLVAGVHDPERPLLTMMFMGPTGVGKTETVRSLAETIFGNKRAFTRVNCQEYSAHYNISKLLGSPPGYVGGEIRPLLSQENIDFFAGIARQVSIGLVNHRLLEEHKRNAQLQHDIELARKIQTRLFPANLPQREDVRMAALNEPGNRVSGDYYDVIELEDGRVVLLIADVTGEGIPASLLMANLQAAARVTIDTERDPGSLLTAWNRLICANTDSFKFITCLIAVVTPGTGEIALASAGHYMPLVYAAGRTEPEDLDVEPGYPLGVMDDAVYATAHLKIDRLPFLLLTFTDGVSEAMDPDRKQFGTDRLRRALANLPHDDPQAVVRGVRRAVSEFARGAPQSDDITLLAGWFA